MIIKIFDDKKITIRELSEKDLGNVKKLQDFINSFVAEDAQIMMNEQISLKSEKEWLKGKLASIKKKKSVFIVAEHNNKIIGTTSIDLNVWRSNHVGELGITIKNGYRGIGLGTYLVKECIKLARKELKPSPRTIKLGVFSTNKSAVVFYNKLGFKKVAIIPKQIQYKGKLIGEIIMVKYL